MCVFLPGVAPTSRKVVLAHVVVMGFDKAGRVAYEHIYWDQASLLVQVGLLDPEAASCVRRGASPPAAGSKPACELNDRSSAAKAQIVGRASFAGRSLFRQPLDSERRR